VGTLKSVMPLMIILVIAAMEYNVKSFLLLSNTIEDGAAPWDCCGISQPDTLPINVADI
jgi:hypothetical protein